MTEDHNAKSLSFTFILVSSNAKAFFLSIVTPLKPGRTGILPAQKACTNSPNIQQAYFQTYCPIRKVPLRTARATGRCSVFGPKIDLLPQHAIKQAPYYALTGYVRLTRAWHLAVAQTTGIEVRCGARG